MKIVLLFPPPGKSDQPYISLPALTAFMRREGYEVVQRDINIEAVEDLLTEKRLAQARDRVLRRLEALERQGTISPGNEDKYSALGPAAVSADYVTDRIDEAKRVLRSLNDFFELDRFGWALELIQRGRELISAEYYPSFWNGKQVALPRYSWAVSDLLAATEDENQNIFLAYFRDIVVPSIQAENPDLIGISITYSGQMIPGLTLARLLKLRCPEAHICLGGAILSNVDEMAENLQRNQLIFSVVDSIVVGEGEHALLGLAQALENGSSLSDVPNLLYLDEHDQVRATPPYIEDINDLPTPDYRGLPLELYLTPQVTALLPTNRGCYWRRCAFCIISKGMKIYRPRKIELVLEDMNRLSQQLNTRCFFLSNDSTSPARMKALAQAILADKLDFIWMTEARLEKSFTPETCRTLYAGGCRRLMLGLESASPRVLELMEKGTTVDRAARVIHNCYDAGISVHLCLIVAFPTETREEARETLAFVSKHHQVIHSIDYSRFVLPSGSKVYNDPDRYGITEVEPTSPDVLVGRHKYKVSCGMTPEEVISEMLPEAARHFQQFFITDVWPSVVQSTSHPIIRYGNSVFLNYLDHFRAPRLEELPFIHQASVVQQGDGQQLLGLVPHPTGKFLYRPLDGKAMAIFNPANGKVITVPAEAKLLLSLCDGKNTVEQAVDCLASTSTGANLIKRYYLDLQLFAQLIDQGFLTIARQDVVH